MRDLFISLIVRDFCKLRPDYRWPTDRVLNSSITKLKDFLGRLSEDTRHEFMALINLFNNKNIKQEFQCADFVKCLKAEVSNVWRDSTQAQNCYSVRFCLCEFVLRWGGIILFSPRFNIRDRENQRSTVNLIESIVQLDRIKEADVVGNRCFSGRISSWSKLLAFHNPENYQVYDSRIYRYLATQWCSAAKMCVDDAEPFPFCLVDGKFGRKVTRGVLNQRLKENIRRVGLENFGQVKGYLAYQQLLRDLGDRLPPTSYASAQDIEMALFMLGGMDDMLLERIAKIK